MTLWEQIKDRSLNAFLSPSSSNNHKNPTWQGDKLPNLLNLFWNKHLLLQVITTYIILILKKYTLQFTWLFLINPMINAFPTLPNQIHLAKIFTDESDWDQKNYCEKHRLHLNIDGDFYYFCCWFCYYYYHYPVSLGHYKLACVPAVLRKIHLYLGCLATVKADESVSGYLFY